MRACYRKGNNYTAVIEILAISEDPPNRERRIARVIRDGRGGYSDCSLKESEGRSGKAGGGGGISNATGFTMGGVDGGRDTSFLSLIGMVCRGTFQAERAV